MTTAVDHHPGRRGRGLHTPAGCSPRRGPVSGARGPRSARATRGNVRSAVLALLVQRPRHGYEIIQEITTRSAGRWRPSPGSVYPTLARLEDEGLVSTEQTQGRRVAHLTEQGRRHADEHAEQLAAVFEQAEDPVADERRGLRDIADQLSTAVDQVGQAGTEHQILRAGEVLAETRRQLYRILAEDQGPLRPRPRHRGAATNPGSTRDDSSVPT